MPSCKDGLNRQIFGTFWEKRETVWFVFKALRERHSVTTPEEAGLTDTE
jgi:hypothetical protein